MSDEGTKVFRVHYTYSESDWVDVNADTKEEAESAAYGEIFQDGVEVWDVYEV